MEIIQSYYSGEYKWPLELSFQSFVCLKILHDAGYELENVFYKCDSYGTNYDMLEYIVNTIFGKDNVNIVPLKNDDGDVFTIKVDLTKLSDKELKKLQEKADEIKDTISSTGWMEDVFVRFKVTKERLVLVTYRSYITCEVATELVDFAKLLTESRDAHGKDNQDNAA
jgi:hypothetical protein